MKRLIFFLLGTMCFIGVSAQSISNSGNFKTSKTDTIKKKILDNARYKMLYQYTFVRNPQNPTGVRKTVAVLSVGDKFNSFQDYYALKKDSIMDLDTRSGKSLAEIFANYMPISKKIYLESSVFFDHKEQKYTTQQNIFPDLYEYEETMPTCKWEMLEGDTTILGYPCQKAKTHYAGRDYIAWYTTDISLPYGPYKFGGLPGLTCKVTEVGGNFDFTLIGVEQPKGYAPIYLKKDEKPVSVKKEAFIQAYKNFCANPGAAISNNASGFTMGKEALSSIKSKPYNPIEIE